MTTPAVSTCSDEPCGSALGDIDASFRLPAILMALKSAFWLVIGSFLLLVASVKLHGPGMLSANPWLTYGRLAPAGWDVLVYGFAGQASMVTGLWLLARSCRRSLQAPALVIAGAVFWNLGVLAGLVGILSGSSTGREWLEMPAGAMAMLVFGAALVGVSGWMTFAQRGEPEVYPSSWFILLALIAFVWFGTVALAMLGGEGARGVVQVLAQRWFTNGAVRLWLGGFTIAVVTHAVASLAHRPLASRQLALIGFWCLAFFAPWGVAGHGDPFPRWIVSAGLAGSFLSAIGVSAILLNWWVTLEGSLSAVLSNVSGRLAAGAGLIWAASEVLRFLGGFQGVSGVLGLTWAHQGMDWLSAGAAVMAAFSLLPGLLERVSGRQLAPGLVSLHATLTLVGIVVTAGSLVIAGWVQGAKLAGNTAAYIDTVRASMHLVRLSTLGLMILLAGQLLWLVALVGWVRGFLTELVAMMAQWTVVTPVAKGKQAGVRS